MGGSVTVRWHCQEADQAQEEFMNNVTGRPSSTVKTRHWGPVERQVSLVMYHQEITPRWANQSVRTQAPRRTKSLWYLTGKVWSYIHHSTFIARSVTSVSDFVWEIVYKWNNSHRWVVRQTYFIMIKLIQRAFIYMWWFLALFPFVALRRKSYGIICNCFTTNWSCCKQYSDNYIQICNKMMFY